MKLFAIIFTAVLAALIVGGAILWQWADSTATTRRQEASEKERWVREFRETMLEAEDPASDARILIHVRMRIDHLMQSAPLGTDVSKLTAMRSDVSRAIQVAETEARAVKRGGK